MKKYIFILLIILCGILFFIGITHSPEGVLFNLKKQIDVKAKLVYKTGQESKITFVFPDKDAILVISPPYENVSKVKNNILNKALLEQIQNFVNHQESGHIFYIKEGQLIEHRLLSGLLYPIFGTGTKQEITFSLTRQSTSGRPIRLEILESSGL